MKTMILTFLFFIAYTSFSNAQINNNEIISTSNCGLDELMQFRKTSSKFEIHKFLMLNDKYSDIRIWNDFGCNNMHDNEGNTNKYSSITSHINDENCLKGEYSNLCITFSDSKLYIIEISTNYNAGEFKKCYENYQKILTSISDEFPNKNPLIFNNNNVPMGEGYNFKGNNNKQNIQVMYEFEYKYLSNPDIRKEEAVRTSEIEGFKLSIRFVDNGIH